MAAQNPEALVWGGVALYLLGYVASLWLHPWTRCGVCKGNPRRYGSIFTRAWRPCGRCGGTGRKTRLGVRVLGIGRER
ncbi:MAG: hypothetical protein GEV09_11335 [Pseudonocardiaceae bacterium]|nr:hypothetical protein [Pseudonocardiaceae bacterium]